MDGVTGVLVLRIGDGTSAYAPTVGLNRISPAFVDEYRVGDLDAPYLAQTITLPFTPELVAQRGVPGSRLCGVSGRGDSGIESILQLSVDGSAVSLGCFDAPAGTNSSVYALPGVDKVVALLRQDGTVDTRTAFAAYAGGSLIATLYDSAASGRFYVAGYNTSGIGIRTFVSGAATAGAGAPATPTVTNSDSVWIGVTFKALGTDASRSGLLAAANSGTGLSLNASRSGPPYTPAVARSLAIAALAALGAGGDDARANTEALAVDQNSEFCLNMSKLMLFQCLAASRPSYEDMFCVGRHVARDLATCTAQNITPIPAELPVTAVADGAPDSAPVQTPVAEAAAAASVSATAALNSGR
jgi:hypothetical protein